jgi:endonuclease/exonuclease/phosphatase family metal-dependent hydrolase
MAYRIVVALERAGSRRVLASVALAAVALLAVSLSWCGGAGLRVATFNIENFREGRTDLSRLSQLLEQADADVIAVQEIEDPAGFAAVVQRLRRDQRSYALALSRCGGRSKMHVGFVYDSARIQLVDRREYPELDPDGGGSCGAGERSGLLGQFRMETRAFELLVVHLAAGGDEDKAARRRMQWERALTIVERRRKDGATAFAILGDTNSTGYLDDRWGERTYLEERLGRAGLDRACSTTSP